MYVDTQNAYMDGPKVMRMIYLRSAVGLGKDSGGCRWRGNPDIQFDLAQLSPRLCSSQYVSKVRSCFCVLSRAKMRRSLEQRYMIEFCVKLGKSGSETLHLLRTAYGDAVLSSAQVFKWHKAFKDGRESVENERRAGHPSTARTENNVARVKVVLDRDRRLQVWLIAEEVGLPKTDVHRIITEDLHMRKICAKLVLKNLSDEQKDNRVLVSREILDRVKSEPDFLQGVITGDETWVFEYDPTTKRQSSEWHTSESPRPKKARMSKSRVKSMLIIFFLFKGN